MARIVLDGVTKVFDKDVVAVDDVTMQIGDGEFMVLVGPSGCGKSTMLRLLAGLEEVSTGDLFIDGQRVNDLEPKDRDIAMVFQNYALYPHMSVFDNMAYGLKIRGLSRPEIDKRVVKAARILDLEQLLKRKPWQLSGGQRQRVAMGRAIVREPRAFLFDEPLSNLDAKLRVQMRLEIKKLQRQLGVTSIFVTHDQVEAMTLGDMLVVMNAGLIEQIGSPLEVYQRPASVFVAGFIGSPAMNFMPGRLDDGFVDLGGGVRLPAPLGAGRPGQAVMAGVRPEHLAPVDQAQAHLSLEAEVIEELGAEELVHGRAGAFTLVARLAGGYGVAPGQALHLAAFPDQVHLFDAQTGRRLE